jgi:hypothetical protein
MPLTVGVTDARGDITVVAGAVDTAGVAADTSAALCTVADAAAVDAADAAADAVVLPVLLRLAVPLMCAAAATAGIAGRVVVGAAATGGCESSMALGD